MTIRLVRSRAAEWGVDPAKVGAGGFSAGGELAELVALRNDGGNSEAADVVERQSSRPDFQVLHLSRQEPADSAGRRLAAGVHGRRFRGPPGHLGGLAEAYLRFKKAGVQAELHLYAKTGHGFGIRPERAGQSHQAWPVQLMSFLRQLGMIKRRKMSLLVRGWRRQNRSGCERRIEREHEFLELGVQEVGAEFLTTSSP